MDKDMRQRCILCEQTKPYKWYQSATTFICADCRAAAALGRAHGDAEFRGRKMTAPDSGGKEMSEIDRLKRYDELLTAVMPPDFKDWHQNSREEWPELAADVIQNLRQSESHAWDMCEANAKEVDRLKAEVERLRKALRVVLAARPSLTEKGWQVVQEALGEGGKKEINEDDEQRTA